MSDTRQQSAEPSVSLTDDAIAKLRGIVGNSPRPVAGLRIQITGRVRGSFEHVLSLVEQGKETEGDLPLAEPGLPVPIFVEGKNAAYLSGVQVHYRYKGEDRSGLEFTNPNPLWWGKTEAQIQQIIDDQLNPAIAAHGGYMDLLYVEGTTAVIELGGGCQGCGMADVTLKQGIEATIVEAVPEIEQVVDQTDHASGENPYYQPTKK